MKLHTERVRLNREGYDRRGKYFGSPESPLFNVSSDEPPYDINVDVRAPTAAAARRKVEIMKGLRRETAKEKGYHPLYDRSERLRRAINEASPYGHMPGVADAQKWLRQAERIAAAVRAENPDDRAWRYADADLERAREALKSRYADRPQAAAAKTYIRMALEAVSGAASRAGKGTRDPHRRRSRRDPNAIWDVSLQVVSPSRPNLKHQVQYVARATNKEEAIEQATRAARSEGESVIGVVSAHRRRLETPAKRRRTRG